MQSVAMEATPAAVTPAKREREKEEGEIKYESLDPSEHPSNKRKKQFIWGGYLATLLLLDDFDESLLTPLAKEGVHNLARLTAAPNTYAVLAVLDMFLATLPRTDDQRFQATWVNLVNSPPLDALFNAARGDIGSLVINEETRETCKDIRSLRHAAFVAEVIRQGNHVAFAFLLSKGVSLDEHAAMNVMAALSSRSVGVCVKVAHLIPEHFTKHAPRTRFNLEMIEFLLVTWPHFTPDDRQLIATRASSLRQVEIDSRLLALCLKHGAKLNMPLFRGAEWANKVQAEGVRFSDEVKQHWFKNALDNTKIDVLNWLQEQGMRFPIGSIVPKSEDAYLRMRGLVNRRLYPTEVEEMCAIIVKRRSCKWLAEVIKDGYHISWMLARDVLEAVTKAKPSDKAQEPLKRLLTLIVENSRDVHDGALAQLKADFNLPQHKPFINIAARRF